VMTINSLVEPIELSTDWPVGPVNVFLLYGEKLTLVDAGRNIEKAQGEFEAGLKRLGVKLKDIEQVVLTHHHGDHVGLLQYVLSQQPIPLLGHSNCRPYLSKDARHFENSKKFFKGFYREFGLPLEAAEKLASFNGWDQIFKWSVELTGELDEGRGIPGLPDWEVIETKGHAQSHISLYHREKQILICGDHLIKHSPAGVFLEPPIYPETERSKPLIQYVDNLKKLLNYPVKYTLSGHGEPIENLPEHIHTTLEKIDKRAAKVKRKLLNGQKTGFELIQELYPRKFEQSVALFASDTIGLLDLLVHRGEIHAEKRDEIIFHSC
jgi:glyoxylase-like metal-dependent hydrolase (beta-lactamase superfamily II)